MKIKLLFPFFILFTSGLIAVAQPVVTAANAQIIGDSITVYRCDTLGLNPGAAGANAIWNFATLDSIGVVYRYTMAPASTPYPTLYPTANRAEKTVSGTSNNYQFYKTNSDSSITVGTSGGVIDSTIYKMTDKTAIFPFTYNGTYYDTSIAYSYYNTSGIRNRSYHSRTTTCDGYGSLALPNAVYLNVLRYKVVHNQVDSLFTGPTFTTKYVWYIEEYYWVSADYRAYLLYANTLKIRNGVKQAKSVHYVTDPYPIIPTGIAVHEAASDFAVYPNPSSGIIHVAGGNVSSLALINSLGQEVLRTSATGSVDISLLPKGLYLVRLTNSSNEVIGTSRMVKE